MIRHIFICSKFITFFVACEVSNSFLRDYERLMHKSVGLLFFIIFNLNSMLELFPVIVSIILFFSENLSLLIQFFLERQFMKDLCLYFEKIGYLCLGFTLIALATRVRKNILPFFFFFHMYLNCSFLFFFLIKEVLRLLVSVNFVEKH